MKNFIIGSLIIFGALLNVSAQTVRLAPSSAATTIDGRIEDAEWKDAAGFDLAGGGRVLFKTDGEHLYVAVRGTKPGWTHLYLSETKDERIEVLHASAALGKVVYQKDKADLWQPLNEFSWDLRDRVLTDEVRRKQADYAAKNRWVASNNNMGNRAEVEFRINLPNPETKKLRLAVVYAVDRNAYHFFPARLADDSLKAELVAGNRVENVKFAPSQWAEIVLETKKRKP